MGASSSTVLGAGDAVRVMADTIVVVAAGEQTADRLLVVEIHVPPGGGPPPLHTHAPDEVFHVMEGSITVWKGEAGATKPVELARGKTVHVPGGTPHTFRNLTDRPAVLLVTFSPAAMMEGFFAAVGVPVAGPGSEPPADLGGEVARVLAAGARLGLMTLDEP